MRDLGQTRPAAACCVAEPFGDLALAIKAVRTLFHTRSFWDLAGGRARAPSRVESLRTRIPHDRPRSERSEMGRVVRKGNEEAP